MNILLDTHILLWVLYKKEKLSSNTISILKDNNNAKYISVASIWEIEIKHSIKKLNYGAFDILPDIENANFKILDIKKEHIIELHDLEYLHNDPFDRLLMSQAKAENFIFITNDSKILQYNKKYIIKN